MIRSISVALFVIALATSAVAGDVCRVNTGSVFLSTGIPGYVLYQAPQVSYSGGPVGASYEQTKNATVEAKLAKMELMLQALAEKGLADGSVSAKAFAVIAQPTINQYCVACHRVAAPEAGKPFALTDIAALTPEQRIKVIEVIMTDDEAAMMPKAGSAQRKQWNAEAAAAAMREVTKAKPYQAEGPGTLSAPKP